MLTSSPLLEHVDLSHTDTTVFEVARKITTEAAEDAVEEVGAGYGGEAAFVTWSVLCGVME